MRRRQNEYRSSVASNYRFYPPYPISAKEGHGGRIQDVDGNEVTSITISVTALLDMATAHPAVMKAGPRAPGDRNAVWNAARYGTRTGRGNLRIDSPWKWSASGNSGTEVTMHLLLRLARAATGRNKIIKIEGAVSQGARRGFGQRETQIPPVRRPRRIRRP